MTAYNLFTSVAMGDNKSLQSSNLSLEMRQLHEEIMRNLTNHINDPQFDILRRPAWRGLIMALYITVILIGTIGNVIVVFVVARNKNMQNVTNIFIANLAISDIGLCIFSLPIQLYYQLTDHWIFGESLCRVVFSAFCVPMYVSAITILLIAFDRYWLILYPLRERMSLRTAFILMALTTVASVLLSVPVMVFTSLHDVSDSELHIYRKYCVEEWPDAISRKAYSTIIFLFQFCLPIMLTGVLYYKIYARLQRRPRTRVTNHQRKQKTNKILTAIVSLFVVCWLPWNVFSLITELDHDIVKGKHFKFIDLMLKLIAMATACVNPFLYCWLNDNFRRELDSMAIKMKIYRQPSLMRGRSCHRQNGPQYQVHAPTENGRTITDHDHLCTTTGLTVMDRLSTSRMSTGNVLSSSNGNTFSSSHTLSPNSNALSPANALLAHSNNTLTVN